MFKTEKINIHELKNHETKKSVFIRFIIVLFIFILYFLYVVYKFGLENGVIVAILSWSVFVLATPVADAGLLLDFPIRLLLRIKMFISEALVWIFAILLNVYFIYSNPDIYQSTKLLSLFFKMLTNPIPYWLIIVLSFVGTFLSVYIADEFLDKIKKHEISKNKRSLYKLILLIFIFVLIVFFYYELVYLLNIKLD